MIITISGAPGSGKSTVAKLLAKKLNYSHYSIGDFMREIAAKKHISLLELSKEAEKSKRIDEILDKKQKELNKKDNFVIDSRLGFYFIKNSIKVFLDISEKEAAKRIFNALRKEEKENISFEKTLENIKKRKESEKSRYKKYYDLDCYDEDNYDLVIDTTDIPAKEVVEKIAGFVKDGSLQSQ